LIDDVLKLFIDDNDEAFLSSFFVQMNDAQVPKYSTNSHIINLKEFETEMDVGNDGGYNESKLLDTYKTRD